MGWSGFFSAEKSDGDTGKVSDVSMNMKTDNGGKVTDILVSKPGASPHSNHDHYYEKSSGSWGKSSKHK